MSMLLRLSAALPALTDVPLIYGFFYRPNRRCLQVFPDGDIPHLWRVVLEMAGQHLEVLDVKNFCPPLRPNPHPLGPALGGTQGRGCCHDRRETLSHLGNLCVAPLPTCGAKLLRGRGELRRYLTVNRGKAIGSKGTGGRRSCRRPYPQSPGRRWLAPSIGWPERRWNKWTLPTTLKP